MKQFIPQGEVLPDVDLVVSHGGSGSLMAALAHGLPSILLPLGADQPHNAMRAEALGVAVTLDATSVTAQDVAACARAMLTDRALRERCAAVARETEALPGPSAAVAALMATAR